MTELSALRALLLGAALLGVVAVPAQAESLTVDRIFAPPSLSGPTPVKLKIAPDGSRVTFLRARDDDLSRYDLWEYHVESGETRMLVDSRLLGPGDEELSAEEKSRRERMRLAGRKGIVTYSWSQDGQRLLFPLGGDLYVYDLGASATEAVRRITETPAYESDPQFSPRGRYVSYTRDQDLYAFDLERGKELRLTDDGGGPIKNGMAEFVAQEEMGRYTGTWWAPDESRLAYARVDESPVELLRRFEIGAEEVKIVEQRYPRAGTPNVRIALFSHELATGKKQALDLGDDPNIYVYRVDWFPDSRHVAVQRQPRSLNGLDLLKIDSRDGSARVLIEETSETWIERETALVFVEGADEFVWLSRRDGFLHLYLYDLDGELIRRLTAGSWEIVSSRAAKGVAGVDPRRRVVFFTATADGVLERHFYQQSLDTDEPTTVRRLTEARGTHVVRLAEDASIFVDTFSSPTQPPQVSVHDADGRHLAWIEENALVEGHPYHPYLEEHIAPEFGELRAEDGQVLHYRLLKPRGFDPEKKYPALVYLYGGPGGQLVRYSWGRSTESWLNVLAQRGYVVFSIDNRGTGHRGAAFDAPIHLQLGRVEVRDQLVGVEFLKRQPWIDSERLGVYGWSYGGYLTLMMLAKAPGVFRSGIAGAPVTDYRMYDTYYTELYLGHPDENAEGYERSSVFPYLSEIDAELLLIHGMADDNVLFANSTKLMKALQDEGKPFDLMTYPGSKHILCFIPGTGEHCLETMTRFLDRTLIGAAPGAGN